ncbi:MAG: carboxypeptidase regulatory-like domain-containing protein, partial [Vicinamibacteria bacterium]
MLFPQWRQAGLIAGLAVVLLARLSVPLYAQAVESLSGRVVDPTGSFIPGADVTLTNRATGAVRRTVSDADGAFTFREAPGRYDLRVTLTGFKTISRDVILAAGSPVRMDIRLDLAGIRELSHIDSSEPSLLDTTGASLGLLIPNRDLVELPLNGRNFTQLGTLMPGVIAPPAALGGQAGDATPGGFGNATGGFNVNGMRNQSNNFLLDGAPNNDSFNTGFVLRPPPDAIGEFRIFTHAFAAEYGRNAGAVVSVVTRSGSYQWRGSGWWFDRDDALEARNRFAVTKPALDQHQFGGAAGGPIVENRAFVFGYYEGFRNRRGTTDTRVVPSAAQRAGDFSGGPAIRDPQTGQPFPGNVIPPARLDGIAAQLLDDYVPLPNQSSNRYTQSPDVLDRRHQFGVRVDDNVNESNKVLARVHAARTEQRNPLGPANFSPAGNVARAGLLDALASVTTVFGPTVANEARVSISRIDAEPNVTSGLDPRDLGFVITPSNPIALGLPNIGVNGFFTLGDAQQPFASRVNDVFTIADDLTKVLGRHSVKGGVEVRRDRIALAFINRPNGNFTFNGQYTGSAAADFLLGLPQQYRQAAGDPNMDGHTWATSLYVQD